MWRSSIMWVGFLIFGLLKGAATSHYRTTNFERIDQHALQTPASYEYDLLKLTTFLTQNATNEVEKTRALFIWIASRIKYDEYAYAKGVPVTKDPLQVLKRKKAVCEGYSELFYTMCRLAHLECETITGYAKGRGYTVQSHFKQSNHQWNRVKLNGTWELFDVTWARTKSGLEKNTFSSNSEKAYAYFAIDPKIMVLTHYPLDTDLLYLDTKPTLEDFEAYPYIDISFFFLGFDVQHVWQKLTTNAAFTFPEVFSTNLEIKILESPISGTLDYNTSYVFKIASTENVELALIEKDEFIPFEKDSSGYYYLKFVPKQSIQLVGKRPGEQRYHTLLKYGMR